MENDQPYDIPVLRENRFQNLRSFFYSIRSSSRFLRMFAVVALAIVIPATLYLNQRSQDIRQHASTNGSLTILDATTNQPITQVQTPDVKLQILLPDNWELPSPSPSSRLHIIQQTYAQTTTPTVTPLTPTAAASLTSTPTGTTTATPATSPTTIPKHMLASITIANTQAGDGDQPKTITGNNLVTLLANPTPWKLNSLAANQTSNVEILNVAFTDNNGQSASTAAQITLTDATTSPTPASTTIDILDYFLTKHPTQGLSGTHLLSQVVDGQRAYYIKWQKAGDPPGKSSIFEVYTWDDNNIYLKEDHSSAPVNIYTFTPGTWMKRHMQIGEKITTSSNTIQWFDPSCNAVQPQNQSFPIEMTLEREDPQFDLGGTVGKQDVIVLKYDSSAGNANGIFERFYYSKDWGWVKWEQYNKTNPTTPTNTSTFNQTSQTQLQPLTSAACTPEFRTITGTIPTPTTTTSSSSTTLSLTIQLQGIGKQASKGAQAKWNPKPHNEKRDITIYLYKLDQDITDTTIKPYTVTQPNAIEYDKNTGLFTTKIPFDLGPTFVPGDYQVLVKSSRYLRKRIPAIQTLHIGSNQITQQISLTAGDTNADNKIDTLDYEAYRLCTGNQTAECIATTDFNDDGKVDTISPIPDFSDFTLLQQSFTTQAGD